MYLARDLCEPLSRKDVQNDGLGTVDIGSKQLGLHQKSRPLGRTQQAGVQ